MMGQEQVILNRTEKPHSFEFGKAGQRFKVYYNEVSELLKHINALKVSGLFKEDKNE